MKQRNEMKQRVLHTPKRNEMKQRMRHAHL
jgi:hypothetical protein